MSIRQLVLYSTFYTGIIALIANAGGVPQAVTKAPGEANHNSCATCHTPAGNFNPTISLDILKSDSTKVTKYTPGETYIVKLTVKGNNAPKAYGFQMVCLDSLTNKDQGLWSQLGERVKQQALTVQGNPRKYLVQSGAKTNGIFTSNWKAPATDIGKIKFYFTGLAVNGTGNTNGDSNVFGQLTLNSETTSNLTEINTVNNVVYPNPAIEYITIANNESDNVQITALTGHQYNFTVNNGNVYIGALPSGIYFVQPFKSTVKSGKAIKIIKL